MREYLGITGGGLVHIFERTYVTDGDGDIGLCEGAQRAMRTKAGDRPLRNYVPTCLECIARHDRVRGRY